MLSYAVVYLINGVRSAFPSAFGALKRLAGPVIECGRNSIYIFILGVLLSYLGGYVIAVYGNSAGVWIPTNVVGVALLLIAGTWISYQKSGLRR